MRRASWGETLRVVLAVLAPIVALGAILRRPRVVALVQRWDLERRAAMVLRRLRWRYREDFLLLRVPGRRLVLVLTPDGVRRVLSGTPEPYAPASREKVAALGHFQPHGVLVSRGPVRAARRRYNEAVLDAGQPVHRLGATIEATIAEEVAAADLTGELTWSGFSALWWRIVRRTVLGAGARDDEQLIRLLNSLRTDANWAYLRPRRTALRERFDERLRWHLDRAEPGSLAAVLAETPADPDVDPAGQVPHWLFAFDAAGIAAYRTLSLLGAGTRTDLAHLQAAVLESVRLWPTTLVLLRDSTTALDGVPAGSTYVIVSGYFTRNLDDVNEPDRFDPERWFSGRAEDNWALLPFSRGPAACPGRNLVLFATGTLLGRLLDRYAVEPVVPLAVDPLPATYNHATLRYRVSARAADRARAPGSG